MGETPGGEPKDTTRTCNMMDMGLLCLILFQFAVAVAAFITPLAFFLWAHESLDDSTMVYDAIMVIVSFGFGLIPSFAFLLYIFQTRGDKGDSKVGKTVRYTLSKLRIPGFWGASIRSQKSKSFAQKEKIMDCCAVTTFSTIFAFLIIAFYALVGLFIYDTNSGIEPFSAHLLNGTLPFEPAIDPSREGTRVRVFLDRGYASVVDTNTSLIKGSIISRSAENELLSSVLSFGYTIAPGSNMTLNITSPSNMTIYYKKDDTVIENRILSSSFELSVIDEVDFTSYYVNISCPGPDPINVTYDFELVPMLFDVNSSHFVQDHASFFVKQGQMVALQRESTGCAGKEWIDIEVHQRDLIVDSLYKYQWIMICSALYILPMLLIVEHTFSLFIVGFRLSDDFTETPEAEKSNKCKALGHVNMIILSGAIMTFFIISSLETEFEIRNGISDNIKFETEFTMYTGEQAIIALNETENPALNYKCDSDEVMISAIEEFPTSVLEMVYDCNPGSFIIDSYWYADFFIYEGHSLKWDFETSDPVNLRLSDTYFEYEEKNVNSSKNSITVNETGVYTLKLSEVHSGSKTSVTFHALNLYGRKYKVPANITLWSMQESFSMKKLNETAKFIVVEQAKPNISSHTVSLKEFEYTEQLASTVTAYIYSIALMSVFAFLVVVAFIIMFVDCAGVRIMFCYFCVDEKISGDDERSSLLTMNKAEIV